MAVHPDDLDDDLDSGFEDSTLANVDPSLETEDLDELEIDDALSEVSSKPAKNMAILGILGILSVIFLYFMIFKDDAKEAKEKEIERILQTQPVDAAQNATQQTEAPVIDIGIIDTPEVPDIGDISIPAPPSTPSSSIDIPDPFSVLETTPIETLAPPPPIVQAPAITVEEPTSEQTIVITQPDSPEAEEPVAEEEVIEEVIIEEDDGPTPEELAALAARERARRSASMIVINGGGDIDKETPEEAQAIDGRDTAASHTSATSVGNLNYMIAQGKMMSAVLETAINTDLPGTLRAVVSRDVYAESGRLILIPKGSRLIGEYSAGVTRGQRRLLISWNRLLRPDGIDIDIGSQGTDRLGRAGVTGHINNRYFEIFSNSILLSAIAVIGATGLEKVTESQGTSSSNTTTSDGTTTSSQTGSPSDFAILDAVSEVNDLAKQVAGDLVKMDPTITIDQGTVIKIFVNKDLIFPIDTLEKNVRFIQ